MRFQLVIDGVEGKYFKVIDASNKLCTAYYQSIFEAINGKFISTIYDTRLMNYIILYEYNSIYELKENYPEVFI